jgi:hypothetical protein
MVTLAAVLAMMPSVLRAADLPEGILVWSKGESGSASTRKIYRMDLPDTSSLRPLTRGEDVEPQISPDGRWVAYAKAKLPGADYHQFHLWQLYVVSIEGADEGAGAGSVPAGGELKVDDSGYWPSWGSADVLYYAQADETHTGHTRVIRVRLDAEGAVQQRQVLLQTHALFSAVDQVNECFVAPDESWLAARTRGHDSIHGVSAVTWEPPGLTLLARAGDFGCMPQVAPSGDWAVIAGGAHGVRWGDAPDLPGAQQDQVLVPPRSASDLCYFPSISTDEKWLVVGHSEDPDRNAGAYDLYLYELAGRTASAGQQLVTGGFNGWSHLHTGPRPPSRRQSRGHEAGCASSCAAASPCAGAAVLWLLAWSIAARRQRS